MPSILHSTADAVIRRIQRSAPYYRTYNNTLPFKINKTYVAYAKECAARYAAEHGAVSLPPSPLEHDPAVVIRNVYPADGARALSAKMSELIDREDPCVFFPSQEHGGRTMAQIKAPLKTLAADMLDIFRHPEVDRALLQFFRSHYRAKGAISWRSYPTNDKDCSSWLWHSDTYPPYTCKVFLHLTAANAELGATEFMNRDDTMAYRRAGYFGQFSNERRSDLDVFAKDHNLPYRPIRIDVEPGDVTIFNSNYFHRAVHPRKDFRDVVQFLMLPSPVSWEQDYARDPEALLNAEGGFPKDPRVTTAEKSPSMMM